MPVKDVVISVPAYFNNHQRLATGLAAKMAGLNLVRLVNEPTAAALAYSLHEPSDESHIVVLDLGGGTFDVSIIEKFDDVMEIHASGGDNFLGGEDFTLMLEQSLQTKLAHLKLSLNDQARLHGYAERFKYLLTAQETASLDLVFAEQKHRVQITRTEFETLTLELINRMKKPILRTLRDSAVKPATIDHVVLVGGATRMPFVRKLAASIFGRLPSSHLDPDTVVAIGAAIQGALISKNQGMNDKVLTDVCPYSLGIQVAVELGPNTFESGVFSPILERNQTIPLSRVERFHPLHDDQKTLLLEIYQGESRQVANNIKLGTLEIPINHKQARQEQVLVRFTYDVSGVLEVEAGVESTGKLYRTLIRNQEQALSDAAIEARMLALAELKVHPRDKEVSRFLLNKADRLFEESLGSTREFLSIVTSEYLSALDSQIPETVEQAQDNFAVALAELEKGL